MFTWSSLPHWAPKARNPWVTYVNTNTLTYIQAQSSIGAVDALVGWIVLMSALRQHHQTGTEWLFCWFDERKCGNVQRQKAQRWVCGEILFCPAKSLWAGGENDDTDETPACCRPYTASCPCFPVIDEVDSRGKDEVEDWTRRQRWHTQSRTAVLTFVLSSTTLSPSAETHNTAFTVFFPLWKDRKVQACESVWKKWILKGVSYAVKQATSMLSHFYYKFWFCKVIITPLEQMR